MYYEDSTLQLSPPIIETERPGVVLRQLAPQDAESFYEAFDASRPEIAEFDATARTRNRDVESVRRSIDQPDDPHKQRFGIWDGDNFVGNINIRPYLADNEAEISCWLDSRQTGKGYASLAVKAVTNYALGQHGAVVAEVVEDNKNSRKVLDKLGFKVVARASGKLVYELTQAGN